jgi:hypothetical protein
VKKLLLLAAALLVLIAGGLYYFAFRGGAVTNVRRPATTARFQNSRDGLAPALKNHFIDFSFEHPVDWTVRKAGANDFADVGKFATDGTPVEQIRIGWYPSNEVFGNQKRLEELARKELPRAVADYASYWISSEKLNERQAEVVRFREIGRSGRVTVWGHTLFYKNGLRVTMIATSLSPDVKGESDIPAKGGLRIAFSSLKFSPDKK